MEEVIASRDWKYLIKNFLPVNFADSLSFVESMHLVGNLVIAAEDEMQKDSFTSDLMRDFAVNLMIIVRAKYPEEWRSDWKNEAFLGISCAFVYREEEAFVYIKNAYEKLPDPPQSLIFAYISSASGPDLHLTAKEIAELTQKAINKGITYESAERMASLAKKEADQKSYNYWKQQAIEAEQKNTHTSIITPNVLKKMFQLEEGYRHED